MSPTHRESERPRCPFCAEPFGRPPESHPNREGDFYKWVCLCGAIGAYDATGHNLGDALMEAIASAYDDDWEKALSMEADKDYEIRYLDCYHPGDHRILQGYRTYKSGLAAFVFVKVKAPKHVH
ncbi:MAG: hypothetical protein JSV01_00125 [Desulfobacterales bacterium]|nr:MAG: hypothetical protein JSV01_00125 [Desulfobacterales bacterium]UCG81335.1 MAG: hypothetical protein JSV60_03400 [Desulfobacterales bacterium]